MSELTYCWQRFFSLAVFLLVTGRSYSRPIREIGFAVVTVLNQMGRARAEVGGASDGETNPDSTWRVMS